MTALMEERRSDVGDGHVDVARIVAKLLGDRNSEPVKLSGSDLNTLTQVLNKKRLPARTTLEKAGAHVQNVWIVLNGTLRLTANNRVLDVLDSPAIIGDDLALRRSKSIYSIRAETAVNALSIDAATFRDMLKNSPTLSAAWLGELTSKLEYDRARMSYLLSGDLTSQLAGLLLHRSNESQVGLTQATMASLLNVHRASISRALHLLERQNTIEIGYASVKITDLSKLQAIARNG